MAKKPLKSDPLAKARAVRAENLKRQKELDQQALSSPEESHDYQTESASPARTVKRSPPRSTGNRTGRAVVRGRDGEELTRSRTFTSDQFDIPRNLIPEGWTYQWNTTSVNGNAEVASDYSLLMAQNGWRPVPAERYAGTLLPAGSKGAIIRGGQRLEERPLELTIEARNEDIANARQLISDRNEALKLTQTKKGMPEGFEMGGRYRGTGGDIRMSIDKALDIPRPQHEIVKE